MEMIQTPEINLTAICHILTLSILGLVVLVLDIFKINFKCKSICIENNKLLAYISLAGVVIVGILSLGKFGDTVYAYNNTIVSDNFSAFFSIIFCIGTALTILISINYLDQEGISHGEYYVLLLFATVGMFIMASAADLISVFLGLELMSIALYILAGFNSSRIESTESSLKYFLLGAFATGFLLYGIALIYGATGTTNLKGIAAAIQGEGIGKGIHSESLLLMGTGLMIIGLGFKVASVPFHMWTPDVYEGAPTSVTAFMSVGPKAAGFAAFFRVYLVALNGVADHWVTIIWVLAALTMTVGNLAALVQTNIKRMLAYSSIAHAGYVLVALVAANELGSSSVLVYMLAYAFMNIGAFTVVIVLGKKGEENLNLADYSGLATKHPVLAFAMAVFMFSLAGIPPLAGFVGKFYVFSAAIKAGYVGLAIIGVLNSAMSVYYYLRVTMLMYMRDPLREFAPLSLSPVTIAALVIAVVGTIQIGVFPSMILDLAQSSSLF